MMDEDSEEDEPQSLSKRDQETLAHIDELRAQGHIIIGIDEAGRGSIAGPVTAGACATPNVDWPIDLPHRTIITDSKKLAPFKRDIAFEWIEENCLWAIAHVSSSVIDREGMTRALGFAWNKCFTNLRDANIFEMEKVVVVIDGNTHNRFTQWTNVIALPKADLLVKEVAAASICAKVSRDRLMIDLAKTYPNYSCWAGNKGYGAPSHWDALRKHGPNMEHRISFKGVRDMGPVIDRPVARFLPSPELSMDEQLVESVLGAQRKL